MSSLLFLTVITQAFAGFPSATTRVPLQLPPVLTDEASDYFPWINEDGSVGGRVHWQALENIHPSVRIDSRSLIGPFVHIQARSVIEGSQLGGNVQIQEHVTIQDSRIKGSIFIYSETQITHSQILLLPGDPQSRIGRSSLIEQSHLFQPFCLDTQVTLSDCYFLRAPDQACHYRMVLEGTTLTHYQAHADPR